MRPRFRDFFLPLPVFLRQPPGFYQSMSEFFDLPSAVPKAPLPTTAARTYRLGIIGSKASGKTCLLAALNMPRPQNRLSYTAVMPALTGQESPAMHAGYEWIAAAATKLRAGAWPDPNPNIEQRLSVRFQFSDGELRKKDVEVFDYSGELLRAGTSRSELAAHLRKLLREMDGLLVLAEYPSAERDVSELAGELHELMSVFALINDEAQKHPEKLERPTPIAFVVNKWDRCAGFDGGQDVAAQRLLLADQFLERTPPPYHANMINMLRVAAKGRFEIFPVSATGPTRPGQSCQRELPPERGNIRSYGLEDPFIWLIGQHDALDIAAREARMQKIRRNWASFPWMPWREGRAIKALRGQLDKNTPEGKQLTALLPRVRGLLGRQIVIYLLAALAFEGLLDFRRHHAALNHIVAPTRETEWQEGVKWLRDYAWSGQWRHAIYSYFVLPKKAALEQAYKIQNGKDDEEFAKISKAYENGDTTGARTLIESHRRTFRDSLNATAIGRIADQIEEEEKLRRYREKIALWRHRLDLSRPGPDESGPALEDKLAMLNTLFTEAAGEKDAPTDKAALAARQELFSDINTLQQKLAPRINVGKVYAQIRDAIDGEQYPLAVDLFGGESFRNAPDAELLHEFRRNLPKFIDRKCDTLARRGENWKEARLYAEQFLTPGWREVVSEEVIPFINQTVERIKQLGDTYLYQVAHDNKLQSALSRYLDEAPLGSMRTEVNAYKVWLAQREAPAKLTFRLMAIEWGKDVDKKGLLDRTAIKFYVNGQGDSRNAEPGDDARVGTSEGGSAYRAVTIEHLAQNKGMSFTFQVFNVGKLSRAWTLLLDYTKDLRAEDLAAQPRREDMITGTRIRVEVDGVQPEPVLPAIWHSTR